MVLQKKSNQILCCLLIAYVFFAFLMPISSGLAGLLCVLSLLAIIFLNDTDILCFLAFSVCFASGTRLNTLFITTFDIVLGFLIVKYLILAIKRKDKQSIKFVCITACATLILLLYGLILTKFHFYKIRQSLGLILTIVVLYILDKVDIKKIVTILSLGLISSAILSLISYLCGLYVYLPFIVDATSKFRFGAYFTNINALAMYCSLCQSSILALMLLKKMDVKKYIALLIAITVIGFSTFSKTFALLTIVAYTFAGVMGFVKSNNKKNYIKFALIAICVIALLAIIFNGYIKTIINRFSSDTSYSGGILNIITTGRVDIWKSYIDKWASSPLYILFGCGITANYINERTTHNVYIYILYKFGIIGAIALIGFLIWILRSRRISHNIASYLPIIILMINGLSEDITCTLYTSFPILIAMLFVLRYNVNKSKEDK